MINNEKYVKVVVSPTKGVKRSTTVNNVDLLVTENGVYEPEPPYTGFGMVSVDVGGTLPYPYRQMSISDAGVLRGYSNVVGLNVGDLTFTDVGNFALTSYCFGLIYEGNINYDNIINIIGTYAFAYGFRESNITGKISFNGLETISGNYSFDNAFMRAKVTNVEFNSLEEVTGQYAFYRAFYCMDGNVNITVKRTTKSYAFYGAFSGEGTDEVLVAPTVTGIFDSLESVGGAYAFEWGFAHNPHIVNVSFTKLKELTGNLDFGYCFEGCSNLISLSFPALKSTSFGSFTNHFNYMLLNCSDVTVHFPSNLQSVIGSWTSINNGFNGTRTTILFDLPATE